MILLDTSVVTQTMRPPGHPAVRAWLNAQTPESLFICAPVLAEIRFGVENHPEGKTRRALALAADRIEHEFFVGRIFAFDAPAAHAFGAFRARRKREGRPVAPIDLMIAAIAATRGLALATRNMADFARLGLDLVDPFAEPGP